METQILVKERPTLLAEPLSWEAQRLLQLGDDRGWETQVLGFAPPPEAPVYLGDWMIVPAHLDSSPLPARAWKRIQTIHAEGLRPRYMVVHETPKLLTAAEPEPEFDPGVSWADVTRRWAEASQAMQSFGKKALPVAWQVTKTVAVVAGVTLAATVSALGLGLGLLVAGAAMVDPILYAVTEDDHCWIEVDRWDIG